MESMQVSSLRVNVSASCIVRRNDWEGMSPAQGDLGLGKRSVRGISLNLLMEVVLRLVPCGEMFVLWVCNEF